MTEMQLCHVNICHFLAGVKMVEIDILYTLCTAQIENWRAGELSSTDEAAVELKVENRSGGNVFLTMRMMIGVGIGH